MSKASRKFHALYRKSILEGALINGNGILIILSL
jgi:hypothetical protein